MSRFIEQLWRRPNGRNGYIIWATRLRKAERHFTREEIASLIHLRDWNGSRFPGYITLRQIIHAAYDCNRQHNPEPTMNYALAQLVISRDNALNNAPIADNEGRADDAARYREAAADCQEAIDRLSPPPALPTAGRIVNYTLSKEDVDRIKSLGDFNPVNAGDTCPMVIVRVWSGHTVNGQVLLDGPGTLWVTSRLHGNPAGTPEQQGTWHWPAQTIIT